MGALRYGTTDTPQAHAAGLIPLRVLAPQGADAADHCLSIRPTRPLTHGHQAGFQWTDDGTWLLGSMSFEADGDLVSAARQAYAGLFRLLSQTGFPHLLRLWNYLPHINETGHQLERYRQFNIGRQQAFIQAGRSALDGAPAACALGTKQGDRVHLHFLAGHRAPLTIENPRQTSAFRYPTHYGPSSPTFSRAAAVALDDDASALLISGTASIVGHASVHPGDVRAQTRETVRNLQTVVSEARRLCGRGFDLGDFQFTVYVRHAADAPAVLDTLTQALHEPAATRNPPASHRPLDLLVLEADICRSDLLVEIEAQGCGRRLPSP